LYDLFQLLPVNLGISNAGKSRELFLAIE